MINRLVILITAGLALSGCCAGTSGYIPPRTSALTSWDRFGPVPVRSEVSSTKVRKKSETTASIDASPQESELDGLKPYSKEWWSVRDAIDRGYEANLAKKLIICRNCMPFTPDDPTGSIPTK